MKLKEENEKKQREKARKQFQNILPGMAGKSVETVNGVKIKTEKTDDIEQENPFGTLPRKLKSMEEKLACIGSLIVDKDVYFALENLKTMGGSMRQLLAEKESETHQENDTRIENETARSLFRGTQEDKKDGETLLVDVSSIKREDNNSDLFSSPKPKMFSGMPRITEESLTKPATPKRRTPSKPSLGSPCNKNLSALDLCIAQGEAKCKTADQGNIFLKKKKITDANMKTIFDIIKGKKKDIIKYSVPKNSFFVIMAFYCDSLGLISDEVKPSEMKKRLYDFTMENNKYTKVNNNIKCVNILIT